MACLVCDHSKRFAIENALREGTPKLKVAKIFGIRRQTLQDHIRNKHEEKNPAKPPDPSLLVEEDPFPTDAQIKCMYGKRERLEFVERLIEERRFHGSETLTRLTRLWRENAVKQDVAVHVADLFAEALKRQTLARGPKALRKQFAIAELLSLHRICRESGDNKTALSAFQQYIELDQLKDDQSAVHKQIIAQFVQIVQVGAPHLLPQIQEATARLEEGYEHAKAVVEGERPLEIPLSSPERPPSDDSPPTPRSEENRSNPGIDTGICSNSEPSSDA